MQLELGLVTLPERLFRLGLPPGTAVTLTHNHTVLLSWRAHTGLRMHAGYAAAPDHVLQAIVRFLLRRVPRVERAAARKIFMAFPVEHHVASRPRARRRARPVAPEDQALIERLTQVHAEFNARHFDGALGAIAIHLSDRMRRRLGELHVPRDGAPAEIVIARRHIRRDRWAAVLDTLLHEMVHQWQAETGRPIDHGREFRRMARQVGVSPRAVADL